MLRYCCRALVAVFIPMVALATHAQSPATRELLLNPSTLNGLQYPLDMACERGGACGILWETGVFSEDDPPKFLGIRLGLTVVSSSGGIVGERLLIENQFDVYPSLSVVGQRLALFWDKTFDKGPAYVCQWFGFDLEPRSEVLLLPELPGFGGVVRETAPIPAGFVGLVTSDDIPPPDISEGAFLMFFDGNGRELHPSVRVSPEAAGEQRVWYGGLSVDPIAGIITVVYEQFSRDDDDPETDVFYRRFSLDGKPLTPEVRVNSHLPDWQIYPAVATAPNGDFTVVWTSDEQDGSHNGIFGQRFDRQGVPLGSEFQVNQETLSDQTRPRIATDEAGSFVVIWESYDPSGFGLNDWDVKARLYRADGQPSGPEIFVNRSRELNQSVPSLAFAPNGTFVVAWTGTSQVPPHYLNLHDVFARRFSASPGDEPCVATTGMLSCDTGRTGGELEVQHGFGGPGSGLPFLGDVDGDGRADPCLYTGGIFRCDTDHEGGAAEVLIPFVVPGAAVALAGDVDGDGRADPCLFGAGAFHCDTRHDGGAAEVRIVFGQKGETPLLGDVNGDGRAEACAFAGGLFRCDTAHNGGKAELLLPFGRKGDQPLLGDFDGDGRDDPCVFRKGRLLCDTTHDGGAAEGMLSLGGAKDRVVLGNLDGL